MRHADAGCCAPASFRAQVLEAEEEGDYSVASSMLSKAFKIIDKNVKRNIVHRNTAARKKSLATACGNR